MFHCYRNLLGCIGLPMLLTGALSAQLPGTPISKVPPKTSAPPPRIASIGGSPTMTTLTWVAPATTARLLQFEVSRWNQATPACCNNSVVIPAGSSFNGKWVDYDFPISGIYVYRVTSVYDDGTRGTLQFDYTRPEPVNPTVKVVQVASGTVELRWPEVLQASFYQVWGKGLPSTGLTVHPSVAQQIVGGVRQFVVTLSSIPPGVHTWSVGSYYEPPSCTSVSAGQPCPKVSTVATAFTQASYDMPLRWQPPSGSQP